MHIYLFQTKHRQSHAGDVTSGGNMSLLNHHTVSKEENNYNMILMNNVAHNSPLRGRTRQSPLDHHHHHTDVTDYTDNGSVMCELLHHVKQINEELHSRHVNKDVDDHYKSEWRMVALVLDRMLLIIFFIITVFTSVVIFINVPH